MPLRRSPNSSVACAKRDSFERLDGVAIVLPQCCGELAEGLGGDCFKQCLAVGKMLVGSRLRDAEYLGERADVDGFRAAEFRLLKRSLNQGIPEIPVVVGIYGFA